MLGDLLFRFVPISGDPHKGALRATRPNNSSTGFLIELSSFTCLSARRAILTIEFVNGGPSFTLIHAYSCDFASLSVGPKCHCTPCLTSRYSFPHLYWIKMRLDNLTKRVESDHLHAVPITAKYYCFLLATERDPAAFVTSAF